MDLLIEHIMTRSFKTLLPSDSLNRVLELMRETKLDGLPVVDESGKLIGMMPRSRLFDALITESSLRAPITAYYVRDPVTFLESTPYRVAAQNIRVTKIGSAPVVGDCGKVTGIVTKANWIMAMFKEESYLNSQMRAIYDSMHNGLIVVDAYGRVTSLNDSARRLLDIGVLEGLGESADALLPLPNLEPALGGESCIGVEHRHGNRRLISNITPIVSQRTSAPRKTDGAVVVFQDFTELEHVIERYDILQSVLDAAYDGILVVDEQCRITMVNDAMAKFLGRHAEDMVGKHVQDIVENTRLPMVVQTGIAERNDVHVLKGKPYVVTRQPIIRNGEVIGAVGRILFQNLEVLKELAQRLDDMSREVKYYKDKLAKGSGIVNFGQIITGDPRFIRTKKEAQIAARGHSNILITGESGTGKELLAQAIHKESRREGPLVRVNCAAIPENLLESEFFGYVEGAFTDASRRGKQGKLSLADRGTLFLDEIGDMSLFLQGKLLRALQDGTFEPVGSNQPVKVDTRIIAATNRNLEDRIRTGSFRSDLYYRLNVIRLHIPPLRERRKDIILLARHFLDKYNEVFGGNLNEFSSQVRNILVQHDWPGNVRELENVVERAANFALGSVVGFEDLPHYLRDERQERHFKRHQRRTGTLQDRRLDAETDAILAALEETGGNMAQAAKMLGISRTWLYAKMARADLNKRKPVSD
jgi:transcriptional regulator with PAS, ATPase and Fis domain